MKRKGFTLVEMLVVIGIIATLTGVMVASVSKFMKSAEHARCQELVANTATALTALYQKEGAWPKALIANHNKDQGLDQRAAVPLAKGNYMSLTLNDAKTQLAGYDRFGVVSPWALAVIKRTGNKVGESTHVPGGGTVRDHVLRYAIDLDGDGVIPDVNIGNADGSETVDIRATAAVWCCGKDGKLEAYSTGLKKDDVYSWTYGQTRKVNKK
jgi:prepilin-type N-terminal cleavage/methylation domain-containing protein